MVLVIQLYEMEHAEHRDRAAKPMVCATKTYGLEGTEEAWRNKKVSNQLAGNGLETLRKYGRISEKIFCGREFLILRGG